MKPTIFTRSGGNARPCTNLQEDTLTPAKVIRDGLRIKYTVRTQGDARGTEGQPLIVPNVVMADGLVHDICIVGTMANNVYCFDANTGAILWTQHVGTPIPSAKKIDFWLINDHWGILGTGVINNGVYYACMWNSPDGSVAKAKHYLIALRIQDGSMLHLPLPFEGATYDPGHGLPLQKFSSAARKQRCGLLYQNGTVFVAMGSVSETVETARGWIVAVDVNAWRIGGAWTTTSRYSGAGIWMGAEGIATDADGNLYVVTGNGAFDGVTDFGESAVKLKYDAGKFTVLDWFTPFTDSGRVGEDPTLPNIQEGGDGNATNMDAFDDMDLGSSGVVIIRELQIAVFSGKDGVAYIADTRNMGKTQLSDFKDMSKVYSKLLVPPVWYTYYNPTVAAGPMKITDLNVLWANRTHHMHGSSIYYKSAKWGHMLFCWGENGNLRAWKIEQTGKITYLACSAEVASPNSPVPPGGMPGGMIWLSANGDGDALVFASVPVLNANSTISPGTLYCYDAENFVKFGDGSNQLRCLWRSSDWGIQFTHNKFNKGVVWNGMVFVPDYSGNIMVFN